MVEQNQLEGWVSDSRAALLDTQFSTRKQKLAQAEVNIKNLNTRNGRVSNNTLTSAIENPAPGISENSARASSLRSAISVCFKLQFTTVCLIDVEKQLPSWRRLFLLEDVAVAEVEVGGDLMP